MKLSCLRPFLSWDSMLYNAFICTRSPSDFFLSLPNVCACERASVPTWVSMYVSHFKSHYAPISHYLTFQYVRMMGQWYSLLLYFLLFLKCTLNFLDDKRTFCIYAPFWSITDDTEEFLGSSLLPASRLTLSYSLPFILSTFCWSLISFLTLAYSAGERGFFLPLIQEM